VISSGLWHMDAMLLELAFAMLRPGAVMMAAPLFAAVAVPLQVRIAAGIAIAFLCTRVTDFSAVTGDIMSVGGAVTIFTEILLGLAIGFSLQVGFAAAQIGGEFVSNAMGLGFAALNDPLSGASSPVIAQMFGLLATLVFLTCNFHLMLIELVVRSYAILPPGTAALGQSSLWDIVALGSVMFQASVTIGLPVAAMVIATQLIMAFVSRAAPALNLFAVGFPALLLCGVGMMALTVPSVGEPLIHVLTEALTRATKLVG